VHGSGDKKGTLNTIVECSFLIIAASCDEKQCGIQAVVAVHCHLVCNCAVRGCNEMMDSVKTDGWGLDATAGGSAAITN
jgi:hypothetical protein